MKKFRLLIIAFLFAPMVLTTTSCENEDNTAELYELDIQDNITATGSETEYENDGGDEPGQN
ncbi:hypothetical protein [Abyssalbus ytuae]|uniref:Secreted protein n=1 Tax=Abyssalbus ytuae TaxID=2926907 RepID=A0A9E7CTV3_9FLAO|nr:hypothetical protein [Abyssalbus ytuae]UOB16887.1 hypothetical protein MQE35_14240 [Abyssalbus ytuae]